MVRLLLEKGANINRNDNLGTTPLHAAALYGHETLVKLLLENGADVESQTTYKDAFTHAPGRKSRANANPTEINNS